jgi:predicted Holliday junction resolvase-like endonuclease
MYFQDPNDVEQGSIRLSDKVRWLVKLYDKNKHRLQRIIFAFVVVTLALIIKFAFHNIDDVVASASVITMDEDVYKPFKISEEIIVDVGDKTSIYFPIKTSDINWKMQALNIAQATSHILRYIEGVDYVCIHARHFGIPFDIIVFRNLTMVNTVVMGESDENIMRQEVTLAGVKTRNRRPNWIKIKYRDESLVEKTTTLWGEQAACFAHYEY